MTEPTYQQAPLRQAYIGHSWSRLSRRTRRDVRDLLARVEALLSEVGLTTFIGRRDNGVGPASERLLRARELVVQDADLVRRGLRASGVELPDAVIAELGRSGGCSTTATFDRRASTHDGMTLL